MNSNQNKFVTFQITITSNYQLTFSTNPSIANENEIFANSQEIDLVELLKD